MYAYSHGAGFVILIFLDLITQIIFVEEYSLCKFLQSPVTFSRSYIIVFYALPVVKNSLIYVFSLRPEAKFHTLTKQIKL
jgi:hypothetical protein